MVTISEGKRLPAGVLHTTCTQHWHYYKEGELKSESTYVLKQPPGVLKDVREEEYRTELTHLNNRAKYVHCWLSAF